MGTLSNLLKKAASSAAESELTDLLKTDELRKNVYRTDDQRMAAFYFSDENDTTEKSKGCFNKSNTEEPEKDVAEKPFFEDEEKGCFKKKVEHVLTDSDYDALVQKIVASQNFKERAMEALMIDDSEVREIEPIHFGYSIFEDSKKKLGNDFYFRTSGWQETWIFFSKTSLLAYQCEFHTDNNSKTETTYEYQYKDITSVKVSEEVEEIINEDGQHFANSCKFMICVPGDSLSCSFNNNNEQVNSVKGMKAIIRDKKNN